MKKFRGKKLSEHLDKVARIYGKNKDLEQTRKDRAYHQKMFKLKQKEAKVMEKELTVMIYSLELGD